MSTPTSTRILELVLQQLQELTSGVGYLRSSIESSDERANRMDTRIEKIGERVQEMATKADVEALQNALHTCQTMRGKAPQPPQRDGTASAVWKWIAMTAAVLLLGAATAWAQSCSGDTPTANAAPK